MSNKAKIFSIILALFLILPIVTGVRRGAEGSVLGARDGITETKLESKEQASQATTASQEGVVSRIISGISNSGGDSSIQAVTESNSPIEQKMKEISSGARDIRTVTNTESTTTRQGNAVWEPSAKAPVTSDKYPLGTSVKISYNNVTINAVVADSRVLPANILFVLDAKTFQQLGADPEQQTSITVTSSRL